MRSELKRGKKARDRRYNREWNEFEAVSSLPAYREQLEHFRKKYSKWIAAARKRPQDIVSATSLMFDDSTTLLPSKYRGLEWALKFGMARMDFLRRFGFSTDNMGAAMDDLLENQPPRLRRVRISQATRDSTGSVLIEIDPGATREEITDFISKKWGTVRFLWKQKTGTKKLHGKRAPQDAELTALAIKYHSECKELGIKNMAKKYGIDGDFNTHEVIARIIRDNHGRRVHADTVRQRIYRARTRV